MPKNNIRQHPKYRGVYLSGPIENPRLYSINLIPGIKVYDERTVDIDGVEYREWDPYRSKLAAILLKNPITDFFSASTRCLYLGASSGTTISHLSDIVQKGIIYGVEFAERSIRLLVQNTTKRENIIPILADARFPVTFSNSIFTEIDLIYQDVAQPNQAQIAVDNANYYLKEGGIIVLIIKSQSIDSVAKSQATFKSEKGVIEKAGYVILESINIHKYAAEHNVFICRKS